MARWLILLCLALPMFASYFFDDIFSAVSQIFDSPDFLELAWDSEDYGLYGGAYSSLCAAGGLIVCGMLLDKLGVRFTGTLFVALMVAGSLIVTFAISPAFKSSAVESLIVGFGFKKPSLALAYAGCALFGLGSEIAGVSVTKSIAKWFRGKEMALAMGLQLALARLGTAFALIIAPVVILQKEQKKIIELSTSNNTAEIGLFLMIIGITTWLVFIFFDRKSDLQNASVTATDSVMQSDEDKFKFSDIGRILTNRNFILVAFLCVFFYCCTLSFKRFATAILIPRFEMNDSVASLMVSLLPFCPIIFTPLFGYLVDNRGKATRLMFLGSVLVLFSHLLFAFAPQGVTFFGFLGFVTLGIAFSLVPAAMWPSVPKIIPESKLGTAYSLVFWIQNMGMALIPQIAGLILKTDETSVCATEKISKSVYAELVFIGLALVSTIIALWLQKTSQKHPEFKLDAPNKIKRLE